jgi:hypothetical protein
MCVEHFLIWIGHSLICIGNFLPWARHSLMCVGHTLACVGHTDVCGAILQTDILGSLAELELGLQLRTCLHLFYPY